MTPEYVPFDGGPYVNAALLCGDVVRHADGTLTLHRIADGVMAVGNGDDLAPTLVQFWLVLIFSSFAYRGAKGLTVRAVAPTGRVTEMLSDVSHVYLGDEHWNAFSYKLNLTVTGVGLHWLDIQLDKHTVSKVPFRVRYERAKPLALPTQAEWVAAPRIVGPDLRKATGKTYEPVGRCIYCGVSNVPLTDEHIIPDGVNGKFVLPHATCNQCQRITSIVECHCLRAMFGTVRDRLGFGKKHKKKNSATISTLVIHHSDGQVEHREVKRHELPIMAVGLLLPQPGFLRAASPSPVAEGRFWFKAINDELEKYLSNGQRLRIARLNPLIFSRMIAKIAHGYAVAERGFDGFQPFLADLILGRELAPLNYVGGWEEPTPPEDAHLHSLALSEVQIGGTRYLVVYVRLFSHFGSPAYSVVVGKLHCQGEGLAIP